MSGERFSVDTGSEVIEGTLSEEGRALLTDLSAGTHKVIFPDRDATFFEPPPDAEPPPLEEVEVKLAPVLAPETAWVEIELVDEEGNPVAGEPYWIQFPDGGVQEGALDGHGLARIEGTSSGMCVVRFPNIDENDWELPPHEEPEEPGTAN